MKIMLNWFKRKRVMYGYYFQVMYILIQSDRESLKRSHAFRKVHTDM